MKFMTLSAFTGSWLLIGTAMWAHRPAKAILAAAVGVLAMTLSPIGVFWSPARRIVALSGAVLVVSNFVLFDGLAILASHAAAGVVLLFAGLSIEVRCYPAGASLAAAAPSTEVAPVAQQPELVAARPRAAA
jgi:hypothetical protein